VINGQGSTIAPDCAAAMPASREGYAQGWNRTEVHHSVAVWLSVLFCLGLAVVPLLDGLLGSWREPLREAKVGLAKIGACLRDGPSVWSGIVGANSASLIAIQNFEDSLEDASALAQTVRPGALDLLLRLGGAGSEECYAGRDGWLFYRPDVDALLMSDPAQSAVVQGIIDFASELATRGIRLVVVPVPGKASIHPERLALPGPAFAEPPLPPIIASLDSEIALLAGARPDFADSLAPQVVDASRVLWARREQSAEDQFLRTDSHWTPGAAQAVALATASAVLHGARESGETFRIEQRTVSSIGDTALMNDLPASSPLMAAQSAEVQVVRGADGYVWRPDRASPVLVLGDSYTNIFSEEDLGWGSAAGFAEHLSRALGFRVDKLARNDAGAKSAREMLAAEDARYPGWLDGKKTVVWVMAAREFVRGDWSGVELSAHGQNDEAHAHKIFFTAAPGRPVEVEAVVKAVGALPSPGATPYADYLTAIHLAELRDATSGREIGGEALAYVFTMRDRRVEVPDDLVAGRRIKLRLSNYAEKSDRLDSLNRGELDDLDIMMEEPNFAEWPASQH